MNPSSLNGIRLRTKGRAGCPQPAVFGAVGTPRPTRLRHGPGLGLVLAVLALAAVTAGLRPACGQEFHDNVVILLDASGSMEETLASTRTRKMDAAKSALKTVLERVPASTHIGLLVFSSSNVKDHWVYPLGPRDDAALTRAIELPAPAGNTPLGRYLKLAGDRLLEERARQFGYGTYRLLVVTDGEAQDQNLVDRFAPEIMARGLTLDVIGVGMKQDHTLARKSHSYRRANDPASLQRAVAEVLAEVSKPRTDAAGAEAFDLLAPLPTEVAAAAIQALSTSGNDPIGTRAAERRSPAAGPGRPPSATAPSAPPLAATPAPAAPGPSAAAPPPSPINASGGFLKWLVAMAGGSVFSVVVLLLVIAALVRALKRGGRR